MMDKKLSSQEYYAAMLKDYTDMFLISQKDVSILYLIRHGQDDLPREENNYDQPLSQNGILSSHKVGKRLAHYGIAQLFSSPLLRTRQTADIIGKYIGLKNQVVDELQEIKPVGDIGDFSKGILEAYEIIRRNERPNGERFRKIDWSNINGLEDKQELRTRAVKAINMILNGYPGRKIAVVSHHGFINAYISEMLGLDAAQFFFIEATGISVVRAYQNHRMLITINDSAHLHC